MKMLNKCNMESHSSKLLLLPITLSLCSFNLSAKTANEEYNLICYQRDCSSLKAVDEFISGQPNRKFNDADMFYIHDSNVVINTTTYSDYLLTADQAPRMSTMDAALNCSFDSDYSCSDWKQDPKTQSLVNYIQNIQWHDAPLTSIQVQIDTYLQSIGAGIAVGALMATPFTEGVGFSVIMLRIGGQYFAKVVSGSISGAIGATLTLGLDLQTISKFLPGDVLVYQNGKVVKVIRNGKEIDIDQLPSQPGTTGGSSGGGGGGGSTGTTGGGGVVGGGGGGGSCFVNCGSVYIRDPQ